MKKTLSAAEAAGLLDISLPTLYAYVSRGMLHSISAEGARSKRYLHDEVLRLAARNTDSRRAGRAAERAIDWGVPVLESRITLIADGKLHYRGHDAIALAQTATLEQVAQLLWECGTEDFFSAGDPNPQDMPARLWRGLQAPLAKLPPLDRAMSLLPAIAPQLQHTWGRTAVGMRRAGAQLMRVLAAALVGGDISNAPLHIRVAQAWELDAQAADLLRAVLVSCADHELNASTFTVRCVASTGAHLHAAVTAGLAALSGPRHGGESPRVRAMLDAALGQADLARFLSERLYDAASPSGSSPGFGSSLPGFGHPLYPHGDPRGKLLLQLLPRFAAKDKAKAILAIVDAAQQITGQHPNLDFGLAALELACGWPRSAAQTLFALGRSAGWIAHAMEQVADGRLIRPRARYIGSFEPVA
ncbi:MAG: citrate synthase family protein [Pseudomonadota bacterium]